MSRALNGKTCLVTGAGRGIGRLVALDLAAQGADLVICSRSESELADAARMIRDEHHANVLHQVTDVSDPAAVGDLARRCGDELDGGIYGIVNCAGVLGPVGRIDTVDLGRWQQALAINVGGVAAVCAAFAPQMISAGTGSIVNFSGGGVGGPTPIGRVSGYTTSKAAVVALTEALGTELAPDGVRVNAVAPGAIATTFMSEVIDGGREVAGALYDQTVQQLEHPGDVEPLLALIRFLLSDESAHVTGRFLSARWDDPAHLDVGSVAGSRFTLRRIDGVLFTEAGETDPGS